MVGQPAILGFDPGRDKCGMAVMGVDRKLFYHQVIPAPAAIATLKQLLHTFPISHVAIGDQTSTKAWQAKIQQECLQPPNVVEVDERYTTLEARDRYWQMYPPTGLTRLLPKGMRQPPRPIDDIVAILLIERYLDRLTANPQLYS